MATADKHAHRVNTSHADGNSGNTWLVNSAKTNKPNGRP